MFTSIPASPWCHHLIRSLALRALLWHRGESIVSPRLPRNVDLSLKADEEEQQMFHVPNWLFCRSAGFPLVERHNYLIRSIKNTKYLKLLFLPNLAHIFEQQMWNEKPDRSPWFHQSLLELTELLSSREYVNMTWVHTLAKPGQTLGRQKNPPQYPLW